MRAFLSSWLRRTTLLAALAAPIAGCVESGTPEPATPLAEGQVRPRPVSDAELGASVHKLLRDGRQSPERIALLAGSVQRQMAHAARRFAAGKSARATDAVTGALYLLRTGEGRAAMIDGEGEKALGGAVERLSQRGDEGRAEALLRMHAAALPAGSPRRAEVEEHLASLTTWQKETHNGGLVRRAGADQRAAVARALVDPGDEAQRAAAKAVASWIARGGEVYANVVQMGQRPEPGEVPEIKRVLYTGGATLAALFLRHGDAKGALDALDQTGVRRFMKGQGVDLYARVHDAAASDGAREWLMLAAYFAQRDPEDDEPEQQLDHDLTAAAIWGASVEAYRRDPTSFDAAGLVARSLFRMGLPEAAPLVLADGLSVQPTPATVSVSMELLLAAVGDAAENEDVDSARRTFQAAQAILDLADRPGMRGSVEPTAARARFVMAGIEVRSGNLAGARPLLTRGAADEPTVAGYTTLALVERQSGDPNAALAAVEHALKAPDARTSLVEVADAHLLSFELLRDAGREPQARAALEAALNAALQARQVRGGAAVRSRAERLLGRVLSGYGEARGAQRAFDRALSLSASDRPALGAAMLDAVARALVQRDLPAARAALKRGIEGEASDEDLAYGGLWVGLLERDLKAPADGTGERALRAGQRGGWTGKLAAWASGKLSDAELNGAAQSASQRVEAAFYSAMARRLAGDPGAEQKLKAVASAPVLDLLEVQLARDLTAPRVSAQLPGGVKIP
jgi:tetratricopeptide (TPR) repeat protein